MAIKLNLVSSSATEFAHILETTHSASTALLSTVQALVTAQKTDNLEELAKAFGDAVFEKCEGLGVSPATLKAYVSTARRVIRGMATPDGVKLVKNCVAQGLGLQAAALAMPRTSGAMKGGRPSKTTVTAPTPETDNVDDAGTPETKIPTKQASGLDLAVAKLALIARKDTDVETILVWLSNHTDRASEVASLLVLTKFGKVTERVRKAA